MNGHISNVRGVKLCTGAINYGARNYQEAGMSGLQNALSANSRYSINVRIGDQNRIISYQRISTDPQLL